MMHRQSGELIDMGEAQPPLGAIRQVVANTRDGLFGGLDQGWLGKLFNALISVPEIGLSVPEIGQIVVAGPFFGMSGQMAGLNELFDGLQDLDRGIPRDEAQNIERNRGW